MYTKKEIIIAVIISLVILIICVGSIIAGIMIASAPPTPTATEGAKVPVPAQTEDTLSTFAATMNSGQSIPAGQMNAEVQYVLDTSAIPCLIVLIVILGFIGFTEIRNRRKEKPR